MLLVGLTGGIGSGKSTVAAMLAARGARVIDADRVVRELQRAGTPVFDAIVARFGREVIGADGELDRSALASLVFADDGARADLNAIVHPAVWTVISAELDALRAGDGIVVMDVPLLVEGAGKDLVDVVIVVEAAPETRIARVGAARGMAPGDVRARMAVQASDEERRARADHVLTNDGTTDELAAQVDRLWQRLQERAG